MDKELKDQRVTIMLTPSELKEVDDWSFDRRIRSRGEAIRQLIHTGLAARPILAEVQSMLLHLTRNNPDPDIDQYIEAIHKALHPK